MAKIKVAVFVLVMLFSFLQNDLETFARTKKEPVEELEIWDDEWHRFR